MREVLEYAAIRHVTIQHGFAIVLVATPKDVVMCACDDLDGVQLYEAEVANCPFKIDWPGRGRSEAVGV